jgi:prepilin-type N-terminal cleavage/methylation domain-containing protein
MTVRPGRQRGFTLLEVTVAISILAIGCLMLLSSLSSSERMSSIGRERAIARNVLRAYIERMRQQYPAGTGDANMGELLGRGQPTLTASANYTDGTTVPDSTPIFDLQKLYSNGLVEHGVLKNATAVVYMLTNETGAAWGPIIAGTINSPTSVATISSASATNAPLVAGMPTINGIIQPADLTALGLPRDMNGSGAIDATDDMNSIGNYPIIMVPIKVTLTWISGSSHTISSGNTQAAQSMTIYAILSQQH